MTPPLRCALLTREKLETSSIKRYLKREIIAIPKAKRLFEKKSPRLKMLPLDVIFLDESFLAPMDQTLGLFIKGSWIILLTDKLDNQQAIDLLNSGQCVDYLVRPYGMERLLKAIEYVRYRIRTEYRW